LVFAIHCYGLFAVYLYFCSALYLQSLCILAYILYSIYDQVCLFYYPREIRYLLSSAISMIFFWLLFIHSVSNVILLGEYVLAIVWVVCAIVSFNLREEIDRWPSEDIEFYHIINMEKAMLAFYCIFEILFVACTSHYYIISLPGERKISSPFG
jgi:hypothetical protein